MSRLNNFLSEFSDNKIKDLKVIKKPEILKEKDSKIDNVENNVVNKESIKLIKLIPKNKIEDECKEINEITDNKKKYIALNEDVLIIENASKIGEKLLKNKKIKYNRVDVLESILENKEKLINEITEYNDKLFINKEKRTPYRIEDVVKEETPIHITHTSSEKKLLKLNKKEEFKINNVITEETDDIINVKIEQELKIKIDENVHVKKEVEKIDVLFIKSETLNAFKDKWVELYEKAINSDKKTTINQKIKNGRFRFNIDGNLEILSELDTSGKSSKDLLNLSWKI